MIIALLLALSGGQAPALSAAEGPPPVRQYVATHQQAILDELLQFLAIPNLASDKENIEKNAQAIVAMLGKRGIETRLLRVPGAPPIVVAEVRAPGASKTIAFYAHYDGQPVDASQWSTPPWQPVIKDDRVYARSASDDKAPIIALLAALDALRAAKIKLSVNLKFVFEGEEEAGSPHLATYLEKYADDLAADAWILCDGPVHQSRRPLVYFGARGVVDLEMTVYGPARALHSGHYGNWVPNPIVTLTHLVDSMRDTEARIRIDGYYDDVVPVSPSERSALASAPPFDEEIRTSLAIGRTEGGRH